MQNITEALVPDNRLETTEFTSEEDDFKDSKWPLAKKVFQRIQTDTDKAQKRGR